MRYLSVCSGIEAATAAWHSLGWTAAGFSEIEAFPRAVLEHRLGAQPADFDDYRYSPQANATPLFGDFTNIQEHHVGPIDLLVGGTPCQSFSIAGLRGGLADGRGNLALEFLRLADRTRPRWLVWENVPGVLSLDGGRDFGSILGGMVELGYGIAYRVLDAQFFGVPQRRRRVFVVGHLGSWQRAAAVLFERHSLSGHPAPRRKAGQGFAAELAPSLTASGRGQDPVVAVNDWPADVAPTLNAHFGDKQGLEDQHIRGGVASSFPQVPMCLNAGAMGRRDAETETLIPTHRCDFDVAHSLRGEGFAASEDGTGRGTPIVPVTAFAIQERAVSENLESGPQGKGWQEGHAYTLEARNKVQAVAFDTTQITSPANYSNPKEGDPCHPLAAGAHPPAVAYRTTGNDGCYETGDIVGALDTATDPNARIIAFSAKDHGADAMDDCSPKRRAGGFAGSHANGGVMPAVAYDLRGREGGAQFEGPHDSANLRAASGGSSRSYVAASAVRRLTPRECERLQGFPDDFTAIPWRGKPADQCPDSPRYKALGNSMAVPVMRWIGERIALVDAIPESDAA